MSKHLGIDYSRSRANRACGAYLYMGALVGLADILTPFLPSADLGEDLLPSRSHPDTKYRFPHLPNGLQVLHKGLSLFLLSAVGPRPGNLKRKP